MDAAGLGIIAAITVSQTPDSETNSATRTEGTGGGACGGLGDAWAPGLDPTLSGAWEAPAGGSHRSNQGRPDTPSHLST